MKKSSETFLNKDEVKWETTGEGVRRQILGYDNQIMLVKVEFQKDAIGSEHSHPHTQSTYVASGLFEFTVNGETKLVREGDGIYIAPDLLHSVKCIEPGILIDAFSPMREDFI
jgi:quercetin dioxygenase-like cupin family protein